MGRRKPSVRCCNKSRLRNPLPEQNLRGALVSCFGDYPMRPPAFLKCLGKAALKQAANMAGFGLADKEIE